MAAEEITKYAINSSLGTDDFKPLDKMLDVKVQTVTFDFTNNYNIDTSRGIHTVNAIISEIDISKTIIIPISIIDLANTLCRSISFSFVNNTQIQAVAYLPTNMYNQPFSYTVQLLTFNANVEKS